MAENPPPEFFLAVYFQGNGWWHRPERQSDEATGSPPRQMTDEEFEAWEKSFGV